MYKPINFFTLRKRKRQHDKTEMLHILSELEEAAEKRQAESDEKQLKLMVELQQKARKQEQEHEERMVGMMMSMMQQTMALFAERFSTPTHPSVAPGSMIPQSPHFSEDMYRPPSYYLPSYYPPTDPSP